MPRNRNNSTFDFRQDQPRLNHPVDHLKQMLDIPEDVEEKFRALTSVRKFRKGERITASSDIRFFGFYLCRGAARVSMLRGGQDLTCSFAIDDEFIALPTSLLSSDKVTLSIEFLESSEVICVPIEKSRRMFLEEVSLSNGAFSFILATLMDYSRALEERLIVMQCADARQRYDWFCKRYPKIVDRVSSIHVASFLGITKETLYRIRSGKY